MNIFEVNVQNISIFFFKKKHSEYHLQTLSTLLKNFLMFF